MSDTPVSTSEPSYVGFWPRFLGFVLDSVWAMIIIALIFGVVLSAPEIDLKEASDPDRAVGVLLQLLPRFGLELLLIGVAFVLFWIFRSATPGKMLVSAVIVDAKTLGKPSTGQLIGRYLAYYVATLPFCLGFLWIAFDKRKQGWHDKIAGTVVIKK
jgi:uncharacterized RDD family membrane protein YckC